MIAARFCSIPAGGMKQNKFDIENVSFFILSQELSVFQEICGGKTAFVHESFTKFY
jgi:hypothetical protein